MYMKTSDITWGLLTDSDCCLLKIRRKILILGKYNLNL
jgi:hypothetical protein